MKYWTFCVAIILPLISTPALGDAEDEQAIRDLAAKWVDAYRAGDIDALMATYTDDPFLALAGRPALRGREEVRAFFEPRISDFARQNVDVSMKFERFEIVGDLAYTITLNWVTTQPDDGEPYSAGARSILVYRKLPELGWRMEADIEQRTPDAEVDAITETEIE